MPRMKGADIITEYLVDSKIPYVFGLCGHGNVGILIRSTKRASAFHSCRHATSRWPLIWRTPIFACDMSRLRR